MEDLLNRLKEIRKKCLINQEDIASRVGVNRRTIGKWENGETVPHPVLRKELNKHLSFLLERLNSFNN